MENKTSFVGFLIQCHKTPNQINLLIDSLQKIYNCHIFLHIDKKSTAIRNQISTNGVTLLPEDKSVDVRWGKFSQCEATLALIDTALSSGQKFDYLWLISGQDLPVSGTEQANCVLSDSSIPYIEVMGEENPQYRKFAKRNDIYYADYMLERTFTARIACRLWKILTGGKDHTFPLFRRNLSIPYYFGSSWWCLPYDCIKEMITLYHASNKYRDYFQHAANSDESLFQTLFMQTSYAGHQRRILTYVDWSNCKASPRTFTKEDFCSLAEKKKSYLLARKFDITTDNQIVNKVLEELCGLDIMP